MTWGQRARHVDEGLPEAERARLARLVSPDVPGRSRSSAPPHVRAALDLQHTAGNAAVVQLIRAARAGAGGGQVVAQRQDEDEEDAGQSWASDETSSSSYAGGEAGGEAAYGPPPPPDSGDAGGGGQSWASGEAEPAGGEEPATEPATGGGAGGGGSDWSGGGGGAEGGGGGGGAAPVGEEAPGGDEGGGSSWWPFGGGEETPGQEAPGGGGGGSSWWPFGGGDDEAPAGGEEPGQGEAGDHSADEQQAKMDEGEIGVVSDPFVPTSGSPVHGASGDRSGAGGFHDGGRRGTVPFRAETAEDHEDGVPHAITTGGKTGTRVWGGGGGAGPKGNQHTGTFSKQVEPKYDTDWGGIATNASAWVIAGTGIFDVHRDYMTSDAGDQGNGWWVSPLGGGRAGGPRAAPPAGCARRVQLDDRPDARPDLEEQVSRLPDRLPIGQRGRPAPEVRRLEVLDRSLQRAGRAMERRPGPDRPGRSRLDALPGPDEGPEDDRGQGISGLRDHAGRKADLTERSGSRD